MGLAVEAGELDDDVVQGAVGAAQGGEHVGAEAVQGAQGAGGLHVHAAGDPHGRGVGREPGLELVGVGAEVQLHRPQGGAAGEEVGVEREGGAGHPAAAGHADLGGDVERRPGRAVPHLHRELEAGEGGGARVEVGDADGAGEEHVGAGVGGGDGDVDGLAGGGGRLARDGGGAEPGQGVHDGARRVAVGAVEGLVAARELHAVAHHGAGDEVALAFEVDVAPRREQVAQHAGAGGGELQRVVGRAASGEHDAFGPRREQAAVPLHPDAPLRHQRERPGHQRHVEQRVAADVDDARQGLGGGPQAGDAGVGAVAPHGAEGEGEGAAGGVAAEVEVERRGLDGAGDDVGRLPVGAVGHRGGALAVHPAGDGAGACFPREGGRCGGAAGPQRERHGYVGGDGFGDGGAAVVLRGDGDDEAPGAAVAVGGGGGGAGGHAFGARAVPPVDGELVLVERARVGDAGGEHGGAVGVGRGDRELQGRRQVVDVDGHQVAARLQPVRRPRAEHDLAVLQGDEGVVGLVTGRGEAGDDLPGPVGRVAVHVLGCGVQGDEAAFVDVEVGPGVDERGAVGGDGDAALDDGLGAVFEGGGGGAEGVGAGGEVDRGLEAHGAGAVVGQRQGRRRGDRRAAVHRHGQRAQLGRDEARQELRQRALVRHLHAHAARAVGEHLQRPPVPHRRAVAAIVQDAGAVGRGDGDERGGGAAGDGQRDVAAARLPVGQEDRLSQRLGRRGEHEAGAARARLEVGTAPPLADVARLQVGGVVDVGERRAAVELGERAEDDPLHAAQRLVQVGVAVGVEVGVGRDEALDPGLGRSVDGASEALKADDPHPGDRAGGDRLVDGRDAGQDLAVEHGVDEAVGVGVAADGGGRGEGGAREVDGEGEGDARIGAVAADRDAAAQALLPLAQRRAVARRLDAHGDRRAPVRGAHRLGERALRGGRGRLGEQPDARRRPQRDAHRGHERSRHKRSCVHTTSSGRRVRGVRCWTGSLRSAARGPAAAAVDTLLIPERSARVSGVIRHPVSAMSGSRDIVSV